MARVKLFRGRAERAVTPWLTIQLDGGLLDEFSPAMRATSSRRADAAMARYLRTRGSAAPQDDLSVAEAEWPT
jgi:hypothetical protein